MDNHMQGVVWHTGPHTKRIRGAFSVVYAPTDLVSVERTVGRLRVWRHNPSTFCSTDTRSVGASRRTGAKHSEHISPMRNHGSTGASPVGATPQPHPQFLRENQAYETTHAE